MKLGGITEPGFRPIKKDEARFSYFTGNCVLQSKNDSRECLSAFKKGMHHNRKRMDKQPPGRVVWFFLIC